MAQNLGGYFLTGEDGVADESGNDNPVSTSGTVSTPSTCKWGSHSIYIPTYSYVTIGSTSNSYTVFWTSDLTIDGWFRFDTLGYRQPLFAGRTWYDSINVGLFLDATNKLMFFTSRSSPVEGTTTLEADTWYHLALTRKNGVFTSWVNGSAENTLSHSGAICSPADWYRIGYFQKDSNYARGIYVDNYRVINGTSLWDDDFDLDKYSLFYADPPLHGLHPVLSEINSTDPVSGKSLFVTPLPNQSEQAITLDILEYEALQFSASILSSMGGDPVRDEFSLSAGLGFPGALIGLNGLVNEIISRMNLPTAFGNQSQINSLTAFCAASDIEQLLSGLGIQSQNTLLTALGLQSDLSLSSSLMQGIKFFLLHGMISGSVQTQQALLSIIARGDNARAEQFLVSAIADGLKGLSCIISELGTSLNNTVRLTNILARGDNVQSSAVLINNIAGTISGHIVMVNQIAVSVGNISAMLTALSKDPVSGVDTLKNNLVDEVQSLQQLKTSLDDSTAGIAEILNVLDDARAAMTITGVINEIQAKVTGVIRLSNMLSTATVRPDTTYRIYIDGMDVTMRIQSADVSISQGSVHNSVTISSIDPGLYQQISADPRDSSSRIEIQIGTGTGTAFVPARSLLFLMESISENSADFSIWGRSPSAKADSPFASTINGYVLDSDTLISDIAEDVCTDVAVTWDAPDWTIKSNWSFAGGTSLDALSSLAKIGNFIIRTDDAGNLTIRDKYPFRPCELETADIDVDYSSTWNMISRGVSETQGERITGIDVDGSGTPVFLPEIEVEEVEGNRAQGQLSFVYVYWAGKKPASSENFGTIVTDGRASLYFENTTREIEEVVYFTEGTATLSRPIESLISYEWHGESGGNLGFAKNSKELSCDADYAVCQIKYTVKYDVYKLHGHNVPELLFALWARDTNAISLTVKSDSSPQKAATESISDENITNENIAVHIASRRLDELYYTIKTHTITAPYHSGAIPGVVCFVDDLTMGISGRGVITRADINFDGPKVTNTLEVVQWIS